MGIQQLACIDTENCMMFL